MKKLLIIHHSGLIGGAGVSLVNNLASLSESHEVTVCVPSEPDAIGNLIRERCPSVHVLTCERRIGAITSYSGGDGIFSARLWYRILLILKQRRSWNRRIEEIDPEIVAVNSRILCWMSRLSAVKKRKSVCFVRETVEGSPARPINRRISSLLDGFDRVIFLSEYDRKTAELKKAQSEVVCNYVNPMQFHPSENADEALGLDGSGRFRVLYVGGVSRMKGFDLAVKAVLEAGEAFELICAGIGFEEAAKSKSRSARRYAEKMKEYLEQNDRNRQIRMIGVQKDLSDCYTACDVLLFPMRDPHQARPAFEAGYFEKPVVITDFENIRDFVRDGENGLTVRPESVEDIVLKLKLLRDDGALCRTLGQKNGENTRKNHNMTRNVAKIGEIFQELV